MKMKSNRVKSTAANRSEMSGMLDSMAGVPGTEPFKGRLIYGAKTIKALRTKLGYSQKAFAQLLQLEAPTVASWEQGWRVPDRKSMAMLIILEKHPKQFVGFLEEAISKLERFTPTPEQKRRFRGVKHEVDTGNRKGLDKAGSLALLLKQKTNNGTA